MMMFLHHPVKRGAGQIVEADFHQGGLQHIMEHFHHVIINDRSCRPADHHVQTMIVIGTVLGRTARIMGLTIGDAQQFNVFVTGIDRSPPSRPCFQRTTDFLKIAQVADGIAHKIGHGGIHVDPGR